MDANVCEHTYTYTIFPISKTVKTETADILISKVRLDKLW